MIRRVPALLVGSLLGAVLAAPVAAQGTPRDDAPLMSADVEVGYAVVDRRHILNSPPAFVTLGVGVRTRGRVFAFAGARAPMTSGFLHGDERGEVVHDEDGYQGFRHTGQLGGGPWVRAGIGAALTGSPGSPTVSLAGGTMGMSDPHPWVGAAVGVPMRGGWRVEAELGWDRNWVEDRFSPGQPAGSGQPPFPGYTRRSEEWFGTFQLGAQFRL